MKTCSRKNLCKSVYSTIIHYSQKAEVAQVSNNWQMGQQNVVYPYNEIILDNKKKNEVTFPITYES